MEPRPTLARRGRVSLFVVVGQILELDFSLTLDGLHNVLQAVPGPEEYHLHRFIPPVVPAMQP